MTSTAATSNNDNDDAAVATVTAVPRRPLGQLYNNNNPRLAASVSIVGLGCSSFSTFFWTDAERNRYNDVGWTADTLHRDHPKVQEWIETLRYAVEDCGITLLDTAPWYGHGTSEVVMGWAFELLFSSERRGKIQREDLTINTKVGRYQADPNHQFDYSYDTTIQSVDRSLKRMNITYIDVLQLHDPEFSPSLELLLEQTIPAMIHCQQQGKCKALGMTGYPLHVQYLILQRTLDFVPPPNNSSSTTIGTFVGVIWDQALTYGHFNLHDTSIFTQPIFPITTTTTTTTSTMTTNHDDDSRSSTRHVSFAGFCQEHHIALLAAAPLSLGLLTPQGPPEWYPAPVELQDACRQARIIAQEYDDVNIATLALVVALANPSIPCTILGMKNVTEVQLAVAAANRFHHTIVPPPRQEKSDSTAPSSSLRDILSQVLTENEFIVWNLLQDPVHGPFAQVWKNGNYQWDGVQSAKEFWKQVDGVEYQDWATDVVLKQEEA